MSRWDWLGLTEKRWRKNPDEEVRPAKTAWDWLQVAVVPVALVVIALVFNASQTARDREREEERTRQDRALARETRLDATLETYLSRMSELMLDRRLLSSPPDSTVRAVARTVTLTALRRLDGVRKGEIVRFLAESRLLRDTLVTPPPKCARRLPPRNCVQKSARIYFPGATRVDLSGADLRGVVLPGARLSGVVLSRADLRDADFAGASLSKVHLESSDLEGASFRRARLAGTVFTYAQLQEADFDRALLHPEIGSVPDDDRVWLLPTELGGACLTQATFRNARLDRVEMARAYGSRTDFTGAIFENVRGRAALKDANLKEARGAPAEWANPPRRGQTRCEFAVSPALP